MTSLSIILPSVGRMSLQDTLASIAPQLRPGDDLIVDVNDDSPWGHDARNRRMQEARGDALLFIDDDDVYEPGAFDVIREEFEDAPDRVHMFRMRYQAGNLLWRTQEVRDGNVSTQMVCVPWMARYPLWGDRYQGDLDFIQGVVRELGQPIWHDDVIVAVGK